MKSPRPGTSFDPEIDLDVNEVNAKVDLSIEEQADFLNDWLNESVIINY